MQSLRSKLTSVTTRVTPSLNALSVRFTASKNTQEKAQGSDSNEVVKDPGKEKAKLSEEVLVPRVLPPLSAGRPLAGVLPVFRSRLVDAGLTTFIGLGMGTFKLSVCFLIARLTLLQVLFGGVTYVEWYKKKVLAKVALAVRAHPSST